MSIEEEFGQWLKRRAKAYGLTQPEMAEAADCGVTAVSEVYRGQSTGTTRTLLLARTVLRGDPVIQKLVSVLRHLEPDASVLHALELVEMLVKEEDS